jgi:chromosome segregation ATPase
VSDGTDPLIAIGIQTLSQAVEMLREDLAIANGSLVAERERVEHAERELETERQLVEDGRKRIDELQALLTEGRRQIDTLYVDLADARTAVMIAGSEAAALRAQAEERRGWRLLRRLRWALSGGRRQ